MSSGDSARQVVNGGAPFRIELNRGARASSSSEESVRPIVDGGAAVPKALNLSAQVSGALGKSAREVINAGTPTRVSQPNSKGTTS